MAVTSNSSHARPGSRISAANLSLRPGSMSHPPEVHGIAHLQVHRVPSPTTQADAAD